MMKKSILVLIVFFASINLHAQTIAQKAEALLKKMSVDDKIGQMTQVTLAVIAKGGWGNTDGSLDAAALKDAIQKYHVGSILNTTAHAFDVATWHKVIKEILE